MIFKKHKKKLILLFLVIVIGSVFSVKFFTKKKIDYITTKVKRGDLNQTVSVTGSVVSDLTTDLHFEINGKIDKINFQEGDYVKIGDIISELSANDEKIQVNEARAALASSKANLELKKAGATVEDVRVAETNVNFAEVALKIAKTNLENIKESGDEDIRKKELEVKNSEVSLLAEKTSLANSEKSLQNTIDQNKQIVDESRESLRVAIEKNLIKIYEYLIDMDDILGVDDETVNNSFESSLGILKSTTLQNAQDSYKGTKRLYEEVNDNFSKLSNDDIDNKEIKKIAEDVAIALYSLDNTLLKTRILLNNSVVSSTLTETMLSGFKTMVDNDRIGVNTEINLLQTEKQALISAEISKKTNIDSAQSSYDAAKSGYQKAQTALEISKQNLNKVKIDIANSIEQAELEIEAKKKSLETAQASYELKKAPPRKVDIASLEAQVAQAEASLALAEKNLEKTKLRAPNAGVITNIKGEIGENISISQNFAVMISPKLIIEADISETDIDKVELGQPVRLTFDAFGEEELFSGEVYFIDPAETKIQDVIYYRVKVALDDRNGKSIRSGMTVNLDILTNKKKNILMVPQRAVIEKNKKKIIRALTHGKMEEVEVKTGIRGDGGMIEIISGINEGQEIVLSEKK